MTTDAERIRELEWVLAQVVLQAQGHAMEARGANATIYEAYQGATGGKGEPGNWHGAKPILDRFERDRQRIETLVQKLRNCVDALTFCINGWDESDPFIQKLRVTRDRAQETLSQAEPEGLVAK